MELSPHLLQLVDSYGYLAVFLGSLFEGEAFLLIASFLAYLGKLNLPLVMLIAFFGTWISDIAWFLLGRYSHNKIFKYFGFINVISRHSADIAGKRPRLMAVSMRFMYGLRIIIPFSLGKTKMSTGSFLIYNALGVLIWVAVFSAIGYFFASLTESIFGKIKHLEFILPAVVVVTLLVFIYASHIIEYALKIYPRGNNK